ncbi:MFS general substrate transporter [Ganoderma sinense ZZ0214-1]|uniref:MFS general substrate transporter n=1 Tax=Ganoderma sinense ZZ0214-1 TaxID=1077348 RepID=A0A2G8RNK4_9APHY|nr:MFS general substrate transporter [Ganoderma sinense ZZ0214-1]
MRGSFILGGSTLAIVGYVMLLATKTPGAQYSGTVFVAMGLLPSVACQLARMRETFGGEVKRAVAIRLIVGCGNLGGIAASFIYRQQNSPRYFSGHVVCIGSLSVLIVLCAIAMIRLHMLNQGKITQCEREGITAEKSDVFAELGDGSPLYLYTL